MELRFNGFYFSSRETPVGGIRYRILQFYEDSSVRIGELDYQFNFLEVPKFISKRVRQLKKHGKDDQFIHEYYEYRWFGEIILIYDDIGAFPKGIYKLGTHQQVEINFEYEAFMHQNVSVSMSGLVKIDCLDLSSTYLIIEDNKEEIFSELYEFVAFHYEN